MHIFVCLIFTLPFTAWGRLTTYKNYHESTHNLNHNLYGGQRKSAEKALSSNSIGMALMIEPGRSWGAVGSKEEGKQPKWPSSENPPADFLWLVGKPGGLSSRMQCTRRLVLDQMVLQISWSQIIYGFINQNQYFELGRKTMGKECKSCKMGVLRSNLQASISICAASLCTNCNFHDMSKGSPCRVCYNNQVSLSLEHV